MDILKDELVPLIAEHHGVKAWVGISNLYYSRKREEEFNHTYETTNHYMTNNWEIEHELQKMMQYLYDRNSVIIKDTSQVQLQNTESVTIKAVKYNPIAGRAFRPLPSFLAKKKSILNIRNSDERCFVYCICAYLLNLERCLNMSDEKANATLKVIRKCNPHQTRTHQYEVNMGRFGLDKLTYPVNPHSVPAIEDQFQIRINIVNFYDEIGRARFPLYISSRKYAKEVDLLYWGGHYAWIKDFSGFFSDINKYNGHKYFCKRCFGHSNSQHAID